MTYEGDDFYENMERILSNLLCNLKNRGAFDKLTIMKPFSFVLVDDDKETIAELLLLDDDTLLVNEELLKGLDEEIGCFPKRLTGRNNESYTNRTTYIKKVRTY